MATRRSLPVEPAERVSSEPPSSRRAKVLTGIAGAPGIAVGPALLVLDRERSGLGHRHIARSQVDSEVERLVAGIQAAADGLREAVVRLRGSAQGTGAETAILEAYVAMVEDESLRSDSERRIRVDHLSAEWAVERAVAELAAQLKGVADSYLSERSHDIEFVGERVLAALAEKRRPSAQGAPSSRGAPAVLVARDLSPAETATLRRDEVLALVTEAGTRTTHTAILARALDLPAVVGVKDALALIGQGDLLLVDGLRGEVTLHPSAAVIRESTERAARHRERASALHAARHRPAALGSGLALTLRANIELPPDVEIARSEEAQGIGLYRTEFLFVDRATLPSEEEQLDVFRRVVERMAPFPVTLRIFDLGADKASPALRVPPEPNPALGLRAIRLALARPEALGAHLRAMLRASAFGNVQLMVPMVTTVAEVRAVRARLAEAERALDAVGQARAARVPVGVMIEVPAAVMMADELAREADFLSIGTNDLIQYALAVDRTNRELAELGSSFEPALLRLIRLVVEAGRRHGRAVSVCGAMASEPLAALLLVGLGLRELSVEPAVLGVTKAALALVEQGELEDLAAKALGLASASEVEQLVTASLAPRLRELLGPEPPERAGDR